MFAFLQTCPRGVADRVNLGLIPSSESGWSVACAALKPDTGGFLHVHGNVTETRGTSSMSLVPAAAAGDGRNSDVVESPTVVWSSSLHANRSIVPRDVVEQSNVAPARDDTWRTAAKNGTIIAASNSVAETVKTGALKYPKSRKMKEVWLEWASAVCRTLERYLMELHNRRWSASVTHVEHVKSYAPHVDHVVADIRCTPQDCLSDVTLVI